MAQRREVPDEETPWAKYLREIQERPGWSVARLARESNGQISRATIFRMISGETKRVPLGTVRLIVEIAGDDLDEVLRKVAGSLEDPDEDPRLEGLEPDDPVVRRILNSPWDEGMKDFMLFELRKTRAQQIQAELDRIDREVEIWRRAQERERAD